MKIKLDTIEHAMIVNAVRHTGFTQKQLRGRLESLYSINLAEDIQSMLEDMQEDKESEDAL